MRRIPLLLAVLSLGFAPAPLPKKGKPQPMPADLRLLQGEWQSAGTTIDWSRLSGRGSTLTVSGRTFTYRRDGRETATWAAEIDPSRTPRWLDYKSGNKALLLIYRLEGDTLTMSWYNSDNAKGRPLDFKSGIGLGVAVFQRKKP